ncbi:MAG: glucose-1-phosphate cytidylyltransferase [Lachnospiraceae bacterium]|jgi:glucose-1-phosphate cytidylyltransferase|nr:glucose-1-phosphate cytidylyltransferase [Lachnospiraceae bacterium]MCI1726446.1 glucose-1-phosphate cytidylyltransferase [Lachnospiraceae bacterium]
MKVVILAGGLGTRISEESFFRPKPMIEIGGKPILWHIMKIFSKYGYNEFIICCGYKQDVIKQWFADYYLYNSDITFDFTDGKKETIIHTEKLEPWKVSVVDTGLHTMTGGRIKRIAPYIGNEPFFLTYGDGVADVNIDDLLDFHRKHQQMITVTCAQPRGRFGAVEINEEGIVTNFREKTRENSGWVNAGFMAAEPGIMDLIEDDDTVFEQYPLEECARRNELNAYRHHGFWQCMDTMREKEALEKMWDSGEAPWKVW